VSDRVFRHYTQAELDRNYDQRGWVPNALEVIARYPISSAAARRRLKFESASYGASAEEVLDIFPAGKPGAATLIFIHGGAWQNFTKDDCSFVAEGFAGHGINTVVVNFAKIAAVRLPGMVEQVRRAIAWVRQNIARFGGDPGRLHLCGHSSGAHMAASALLAPFGEPVKAPRGLTLISGAYDLEPVLLSARSAYVKLSADEASILSPQRHVGHLACPVFMTYCENDTDEFQRHSREMAAAVEGVGQLVGLIRLSDLNHFEIVEELGKPDSRLAQAIRTTMA
jgi:arylformamidase